MIQVRLASLQQEHAALKRDSAMMAERALMREDNLEEARQAAEESAQAAQGQVNALRAELTAVQQRLRELQAEAGQGGSESAAAQRRKPHVIGGEANNGHGHGERSSHGSGIKFCNDADAHPSMTTDACAIAALREAEARSAALEQELMAVQGVLAALLVQGQRAGEEQMASIMVPTGPGDQNHNGDGGSDGICEGAVNGAAAAAGRSCLLGVLRCAELLYTKEQQGTSLSKIRVLQGQLEGMLQAALLGTASEPSALLQELQALRRLQEDAGQDLKLEALPESKEQGARELSAPQQQLTDAQASSAQDHSLESKGWSLGLDDTAEVHFEQDVYRMTADDGQGEERWDEAWAGDGDGHEWFGHATRQTGTASAGRSAEHPPVDSDILLQGLDMWELPPLAPPPLFD